MLKRLNELEYNEFPALYRALKLLSLSAQEIKAEFAKAIAQQDIKKAHYDIIGPLIIWDKVDLLRFCLSHTGWMGLGSNVLQDAYESAKIHDSKKVGQMLKAKLALVGPQGGISKTGILINDYNLNPLVILNIARFIDEPFAQPEHNVQDQLVTAISDSCSSFSVTEQ